MIKHFRKRNFIPTELTWEEKNPITCLYSSSDSIERLRRIDVIEKESNTNDNKELKEKCWCESKYPIDPPFYYKNDKIIYLEFIYCPVCGKKLCSN